MTRPLLLAAALAFVAPVAWAQQAKALAAAPAKAQSGVAASPNAGASASATAADAEGLLRSCGGEAQRNAKLYVARAHGIELMKRSADRDQGRSMLRIEAQLDGTLTRLRGKGVDAELDRMEEALVGLTELTLQQPVVAQIDAALGLAERASQACHAALVKLGADNAPAAGRQRRLTAMLDTSQRLSARFLAQSLKAGGPTPDESAALGRQGAAFEADLAQMRSAHDGDAALRDNLMLLDHQWLFMRQALMRPRENARSKIEDVGRASEKVFELIDTELQRAARARKT